MEVSLLMLTEMKKMDGMNVCQFSYSFLIIWLSLKGILTCNHEIIEDDVGFIPVSVSPIFIDLHARLCINYSWLPFLSEAPSWWVSLYILHIVLDSSPYPYIVLFRFLSLSARWVWWTKCGTVYLRYYAFILDLMHYRCNRVYVPWINKGVGRTGSLRNIIRKSIKHR